MNRLIERKEYLKTLWQLKDIDLIKVVTGVRRSGKSTLLRLFREKLLEEVPATRVQRYDFEERQELNLKSWTEIYDMVAAKLVKGKMNYVFLDEVQGVKEFERLLSALFANKDVDLYITGSNAYLLSSELATLLTGRSFTINILPFSFSEFYETFEEGADKYEVFSEYLKFSSLPQATELYHVNRSLVPNYTREVFETIFENDIAVRHEFGSEQAFRNVADFMADNIGNMVSPNKIANILTQEDKKIDSRTVENYLKYLKDSYVLYEAKRFDVKGKRILRTKSKYYLSDLGFRNMLLGERSGTDLGHLLENVVFLELLRRGQQVWVGKVREKEVDFIARGWGGELTYYQVAYSVRDEDTRKRELAPFDLIRDHYPKVLLTTDFEEMTIRGIKQINVVKWLLGESN